VRQPDNLTLALLSQSLFNGGLTKKKIARLVPQVYHRMLRTVAKKAYQAGRKGLRGKERVRKIRFAKPL
jgi:hypothetical protein